MYIYTYKSVVTYISTLHTPLLLLCLLNIDLLHKWTNKLKSVPCVGIIDSRMGQFFVSLILGGSRVRGGLDSTC